MLIRVTLHFVKSLISHYVLATVLMLGLVYVYWSCELKTQIIVITVTPALPNTVGRLHLPRSLRDVEASHNFSDSFKGLANQKSEEDLEVNWLFPKSSPSKLTSSSSTTKIPAKVFTVPECPQSSGDCRQPLFSEDGFVRNCVTNEVVGQVPQKLRSTRLTAATAWKEMKEKASAGGLPETGEERKKSFRKVFETRAWGHDWDSQHHGLNASGMGATLYWTQESIATLHNVINQLKQRYNLRRVRLLDVPCGDMAWMSRFLKTRDDVDYVGLDIVPEIIRHHRAAFPQWKFLEWDVVHDGVAELPDGIPAPHLILCRTLLQHLFFQDIFQVLESFSTVTRNSDTEKHPVYILTTSFSGYPANLELVIDNDNPGRFRRLNMETPPVSLIPPICLVRDGPPDAYEGWDHFLGLWRLPLRRISRCLDSSGSSGTSGVGGRGVVVGFTFGITDHKLFSCIDWSLKSSTET